MTQAVGADVTKRPGIGGHAPWPVRGGVTPRAGAIAPLNASGWAAVVSLLLCTIARGAAAQVESVSVSGMVYSDDDRVTVVAPAVQGRVRVDDLTLSARVAVDVVSAASVDLVSAASPQGYREVRGGGGAGLNLRLAPGHEISASYGSSIERDFTQHSLRLGHQIDLFDRLSTFSLSYSYAHSDVFRAKDSSFAALREAHELSAGWTQVLTPTTMLDGWFGGGLTVGFQASPYRMVPLYQPGALSAATVVREAVPDTRALAVLGGRLRTRLVPGTHLVGSYKAYLDSWGLSAHTFTARLSHELVEDTLVLAASGRAYLQGAARFFRRAYDSYPSVPTLRTADKELGPMWTAMGGLELEWRIELTSAETLRVDVAADVLHLAYPEHPRLTGRTALITTVDLTLER